MNSDSSLSVFTLVTGPFQENCHLVWDDATRAAVVVDPGDEPDRILDEVRQRSLDVQLVFCTHGHVDHVSAVGPLKRSLGAELAMHADEIVVLQAAPRAAMMFGLPRPEVPEVERKVADGDAITLGEQRGVVLHTPGHSPGGCCLYFETAGRVLVGDTLFAGSVGRVDLPGGSGQALIASIETKLLTLPDTTVVHCGHGPDTTIGAERRTNPFLRGGMSLF